MSDGLPASDAGPHTAYIGHYDDGPAKVPFTRGSETSRERGNEEEPPAVHSQGSNNDRKTAPLKRSRASFSRFFLTFAQARRKESNREAQRAFREKLRKKLKEVEENAKRLEQEGNESFVESNQLSMNIEQFQRELEEQRKVRSVKGRKVPVAGVHKYWASRATRGLVDPGLVNFSPFIGEPLVLDLTSDPTPSAFKTQPGSAYKAGAPSTGLHQASHDLFSDYWRITSIQDSTGRRYDGRLSFCAIKVGSGSSGYDSIRIIIGSSILEVDISFGGERTLKCNLDNRHVRILSKFGADTGVLASFPYAASSSNTSIQLWQSSTEIKTWLFSLLWLQSPWPEGVQNMNSYWPEQVDPDTRSFDKCDEEQSTDCVITSFVGICLQVKRKTRLKYGKRVGPLLLEISWIPNQELDISNSKVSLLNRYLGLFVGQVIAALGYPKPVLRKSLIGLEGLEIILMPEVIFEDHKSAISDLLTQATILLDTSTDHVPNNSRGFVDAHPSSTDSIALRSHIDMRMPMNTSNIPTQGQVDGMPFNSQGFGQNSRDYMMIEYVLDHPLRRLPEPAMVSSRSSLEQSDYGLTEEWKNERSAVVEEVTKKHAVSAIEEKVAAGVMTERDKGYTLKKASGHVRHSSRDIKMEELQKDRAAILDSPSSEPSSNVVLIWNTLTSFVVLWPIFLGSFLNAEDTSFLAYLHWLVCISPILYVCGQYIRWKTGRLWIDLDRNESVEATLLTLSDYSFYLSLLRGWSLLPTLFSGYSVVVSASFTGKFGSFGSTSIKPQIKPTKIDSPWHTLWCLLGWSLMGFFVLQTRRVTLGGLDRILSEFIRSVLDRFGSHNLPWFLSDPMSAGGNLKMRYQHLLPVRKWQSQSSGKRRVRGQCRCGYRFVDEFMELRPEAAADYENLLQERTPHAKGYLYPVNRDQGIQDASDAGDTNSQSKRSTAVPSIAGGLTTLTVFAFHLLGKTENESTLPQYQLENGGNQRQTSSTCNNELLFLLLCIPRHQFATRLLQPQLSDITSDKGFFLLLRRDYQQMRGRMRRMFSMRTIRSIKFVQLEMYKSELVDIRKLDDLPPEDKRDEYRYNPVPAEIIPPVGENHMLHLINHPTHAEEDAFVLDRIPKKLKERLLVSPSRGTGLGWGIYFIEGWHLSVITLVAFAVLLAGSLVFLICWSVLEHDLQGASGVAAYMVAFLGLAIGSTQAVFELT